MGKCFFGRISFFSFFLNPVKGCLEVLRDAGYQGPLSLETEGDFSIDDGEKLIRESRDYLLKTLKEIQYHE